MSRAFLLSFFLPITSFGESNVIILNVPDYTWYAGCFGTASGNLLGYWDRNGFSSYYTGPTGGGLAPLTSTGANAGIRSLWANRAGEDGRPTTKPGHIDDYWETYTESTISYESTRPDPYIVAKRAEHEPDCVSDFMGASQNKWTDLDGECSGNIDAFGFNFWDKTGGRRVNYKPAPQNGVPMRDIQSGLRSWAKFKKHEAEVFSQLADFNPTVLPGKGFTFENLKEEIDAGYPVMLFLQNPDELHRSLPGNARANPNVHAMIATGYVEWDSGERAVRYKTSWGGSGDNTISSWGPTVWEANMTLRGVIGYRPKPRINSIERDGNHLAIRWEAPASVLHDYISGRSQQVHSYVLESSATIDGEFTAVGEETTAFQQEVQVEAGDRFYRVRLLTNGL